MKVVCRYCKAMGMPGAKTSFHIPSIPKPQEEYRMVVDNVNTPFEHVWLPKEGSRFIHPLEKLSVFDFIDRNVSNIEPIKPPPIKNTPFKLVEELKDLKELVAKLRNVNEFAVDLEHNQYRSFQGLTCLMQISTRTEDFIIDAFKLRFYIGPYLRELFKDPTKRKVMHGADLDILWMQRDFGIYVCNMFDTGRASQVLNMERNTLEYLLQYFCGVVANKEYQTADWRLRPLTDEMLRYAREDTHYLLYIYDVMKIWLLSVSRNPFFPEAFVEVYHRSFGACMQLYKRELLTAYSYLNIFGLRTANFNGQQLAVAAGLYDWRDAIARAADESTGYILPNKTLIEIARHMPDTVEKLREILKFNHPYVEQNLSAVVGVIMNSMKKADAYEAMAKRMKQELIEIEAAKMAYKRAEEAYLRSTTADGAPGSSSNAAAVPPEAAKTGYKMAEEAYMRATAAAGAPDSSSNAAAVPPPNAWFRGNGGVWMRNGSMPFGRPGLAFPVIGFRNGPFR